jgi:ABC-type proline/glycine betaine transport system ATPase subunit
MMKHGEIVQTGSYEQLLKKAHFTDFIGLFLKSQNTDKNDELESIRKVNRELTIKLFDENPAGKNIVGTESMESGNVKKTFIHD